MRRKELEWNEQNEILEFLKGKRTGTLSLSDEGQLFSCPMNYLYDGKDFYFHGAVAAFKMGAVRKNCKAIFCVYEELSLIPSGWLGEDPCSASQYYRSVIAKGVLKELEGTEIKRILNDFMKAYEPEKNHDWTGVPGAMFAATALFKLTVEALSCKQKTGKHLNRENRECLKAYLTQRSLPEDLRLLQLLG